VSAYDNRGDTYSSKGEYDRAIADYTKSIEINPKNASAYNNRGDAYSSKREYDRAIVDFSKAIEIDPKDTYAYRNRGAAYANKGEHDRAIVDCNKAIEIDPKDALAYITRGVTYWIKGEYDRAIADYTKAIEIDPKDALNYSNRCTAYWRKGEYDRAIVDYTKAIEIDLKYALNYSNRCTAYWRKGEYDRAIVDCNKAIEIDPKYADAFSNRGTAYRSKGEYDRSIGDLTRAIELFELVEAALKKVGFDVTVLKDANYRSMDLAIKRYVSRVRNAGADTISFFYYSGHGAANPNTRINFLIPIDVTEAETEDLWHQSIEFTEIVDKLSAQAPDATHYVVFDACRDELKLKQTGKTLGSNKGFVPITNTSGLLIAYSTAPNKTASDVGTVSGPYAKALAEEITRPGQEAVMMFRNVQLKQNFRPC